MKTIEKQMRESGLEDDDFSGDLADRLDDEFGLIDDEEDEDEDD